MSITPCTRKEFERHEHVWLGPLGTCADESEGRAHPAQEDRYRTCFQRDRDRILHCKAFRRLAHKTQVFLAPTGDHYRTRLIHTMEVQQIARDIARALRLNEDLTEAIALGHDLGHTQGGDPAGTGVGGSSQTIKGEFSANGVPNSLLHTRGTISMARGSDFNAGSSQFFIMHKDTPSLDGQYAAFGRVTSGMEVVDNLAENTLVTESNGMVAKENQPKITSIRIV